MHYLVLEQLLLSSLLAVPAFALLFKQRLVPRLSSPLLFLACSILVYALFLLYAQVVDARLGAELYAFDLNGDGNFSTNEITPDQERAMDRFIADTARTFAPITGIVFAPLCVTFAFLVVKVVQSLTMFGRRILSGRA